VSTQPHSGPTGGASGRLPRQRPPAEAPFGAAGGAESAPTPNSAQDLGSLEGLDSELVDDLGAEYEFRGDVLEDEVAALKAQAVELRDRALRAQAEFDNFRKRTIREREDERKRATERLVVELLPAIDNLERAIEHTTADNDLSHLVAGVTSVHAQVLAVLGKEGVSVVDPVGKAFDPMTQQAVSQVEDASVPDGTVIEAFHKGYEMGGRVIRPAMVVVSTGGPRREE
jgi:molecular chaperone GrpE